ncbi:MAG: MATE family efflux transporter [Actinomycetia bacterium]|nr:MATE family efflux transporter [Actinomycetes bacterium]
MYMNDSTSDPKPQKEAESDAPRPKREVVAVSDLGQPASASPTAEPDDALANAADVREQHGVKQIERFGTAKISKLITEFAIPSIIAMVVNGLYNIVDSIFMGHGVGTVGQATATVAMPIMIFSMAVSMLIGVGGNALTSLRLGEGKKDEAERIMGNCFSMLLVAGIVCAVLIWIFMDPILRFSGASESVYESSEVFLRIIGSGVILQFVSMGFNNFIRTAGDPMRALYSMVAGIAVSIALNWLFVLHLGWGVAGSAWATLAGQAVGAALVMHYFIFSKKAPFHLHRRFLRIKPRLAWSIVSLGSASFVLQFAAAVINIILNQQLNKYGAMSVIGADGALAAIGVVGRVAMFSFFPIMGISVAVQPLIGYNYGAQHYERVKKAFWVAFTWIVVFGLFFWVIVRLFPGPIAMLFGVHDDLLEFTTGALRVQLFMLPVMGLQILAAGFFQSTGQPMKSLFLSLTRQVIFMIPLIYLMPIVMPTLFPQLIALDGLYWAYPICDVTSVVTAAIMMRIEFGHINRRIAEQKQGAGQLTAEAADG